MRLKLGRPDLKKYSALFNVPAATAGSELTITWLGVSTLLVCDGTHAFLTDGFFSRPSLVQVGVKKFAPNLERIESALNRAGITSLDAVVPVHSHFDHVMDAPEVAKRTGAALIGSASAANVGRGWGLEESQIQTVADGDTIELPNGRLKFIASDHCPPDRYPGTIDEPVVPPVHTTAYRCGEAWSLVFRHNSDKSVLIQGSAGYVPGSLAGHNADVAYLGVGQLGLQSPSYLREYWKETVQVTGAQQVVLIHWDDFFRPLDLPLRSLPYAGDDLNVTMKAFTQFAAEDSVTLHFPRVWKREDPWGKPNR